MATTDEYEWLASVLVTESVNSSDFERFDKVYQYMMKNFTKPIKLEEVASLVGLTPNAFCRYFRGRTKKTFVQYLNDIRIGHAKKLLIEGRMKISTLSMESGFNNLSNFIEQFKRSTQMSPSEYQKKFGVKKQKVIWCRNYGKIPELYARIKTRNRANWLYLCNIDISKCS